MAERPDNALAKEQMHSISPEDNTEQPPRKKFKNACVYHVSCDELKSYI